MRILAIYRHYSPDTAPYGPILRTILNHLADAGHDVSVFTAQPSYNDVPMPRQRWKERVDNVEITRQWLLPERKRFPLIRAANTLYFLLNAIIWVLIRRRRFDLIIANTHPPILMGVVLRFIKRLTGIDYIHHCQDIHPEASLLAGRLRKGRLYDALLSMDTETCRHARRVVTLSQDMAATLAARGVRPDNFELINNSPAPLSSAVPGKLPQQLVDDQGAYYVLYAGNLGHFQGLDRLVEAAHLLSAHPQIRFVFMGEGLAKSRLIQQASHLVGKAIIFLPYQPAANAWAVMQRANLAVVSLLPEMIECSYPSKMMTYLSAGCRLLAIVESDSELAKTVESNNLGYVAGEFTAAEIAAKVLAAWKTSGQWTIEQRLANQKVCIALFGSHRMCSAWADLITTLESERDLRTRAPSPSPNLTRQVA